MTYAFLIALALGGTMSAIFAALWKGAQKLISDERGANAKTAADLATTSTALGLVEAARKDETARLEAVITELKAELTRLEADVALCRSPDAVRARLRGLLGR